MPPVACAMLCSVVVSTGTGIVWVWLSPPVRIWPWTTLPPAVPRAIVEIGTSDLCASFVASSTLVPFTVCAPSDSSKIDAGGCGAPGWLGPTACTATCTARSIASPTSVPTGSALVGRAAATCLRSYVGGTRTAGESVNEISETRYCFGSAVRKVLTAARAASSRVGFMSVAPIDPESSITTTTVAPCLVEVSFASGRANPTSSSVNPIRNRAAGTWRRRGEGRWTRFGTSAGLTHAAARRSRLRSCTT